jgi:nucleotide-binding universal stress UspA family protein
MRVGVRLAREHDAELVIVHAWHVPVLGIEPLEPQTPRLLLQVEEDARRALDGAVREATVRGAPRVSGVLLEGVPWLRITETIERDPAIDLVVMGTHGRSAIARFLLGSVADRVARHAACSVLIVRSGGAPAPFTDVLCPIDFSEASRFAVDIACELVAPGGSGLTLLHASDVPVEAIPSNFLRELDKRAALALHELAAELRVKVKVPVIVRTRFGSPAAQIVEVLDDQSTFDLVVMGNHGRTGLRRALLGSTSERVVHHAHCPVFVARRRE